jgi:hypothetical protein
MSKNIKILSDFNIGAVNITPDQDNYYQKVEKTIF